MKRTLVFLFFLASSALTAQSNPGDGQDPAEFFSRIWSPYCHGISLLECPSSQAEDLRREIRIRMKNGETENAIFEELQKKHEGKLRMEPAKHGRESLAYWIPYLIFGFVALLVGWFWTSRKKKAKPASAPKPISAAQSSKILEDLNDRL